MRQQRQDRVHGPAPRRSPRIGPAWIGVGAPGALAALFFAAQAFGWIKTGPPPLSLSDPKYAVGSEVIGTQQPDESNVHVPSGQKVTYGTNPPTSGSHWGAPAGPVPWGIKDSQLPSEAVVHNMEHGGVIIWYKALTAAEVDDLKDLVSVLRANGYPKVILMPYADMSDARIAVSAWRWLLKLPNYDDVPIVRFVKQHYDGPDAPERGVS